MEKIKGYAVLRIDGKEYSIPFTASYDDMHMPAQNAIYEAVNSYHYATDHPRYKEYKKTLA